MDTIGWQRNAARLFLCGTLAAAGSPAWAEGDFASVSTGAEVAGPTPAPTACDSSFQRGLASESSGPLSCNIGTAAVMVSASAVAPSGPGHLAELHAATSIEIAPFVSGPRSAPHDVVATAGAFFRDYVDIGPVRPDHMTFDFGLTGNLFVSGPFGLDQSALVDVYVDANSGVYASPVFYSFTPSAAGASDAISTLVPGQPMQSGITDRLGNSPDFHFVLTPSGQYELTLGTSFFDNLSNTQVLLEFGLFSEVTLFDDTEGMPSPGDLLSISDYAHTLRMIGVHAFDANGNDVTTDAFLGFESANLASVPAVPEPSEWLLMLAGLAWMATKVSRSRQFRSSP